jgi:restriction endonuclease S subunit
MRPNLRKVAHVAFREAGYTSPECAVITVKRDEIGAEVIDAQMLAVLLRSDLVYGQIMHLVAGIGRPRISMTELRQVLIPVPPKSIQMKTMQDYLTTVRHADELEAEANRLRVQAENKKNNAVEMLASSFMNGPKQ